MDGIKSGKVFSGKKKTETKKIHCFSEGNQTRSSQKNESQKLILRKN